MEGFDCTIFDGAARKKRSQLSRRPRPESQLYPEFHDQSSLSSTPSLDDVSKVSSGENGGFDTNPWRKELNLSQCISPDCAVGAEDENSHVKNEENGLFTAVDSCEEGQSGNKRFCKGVLGSANFKSTSKVKACLAPLTSGEEVNIGRKVESQNSEKYGGIAVGLGNESKVKKVVKIKVGGVRGTFHADSASKVADGGMPSAKNYQSSEVSRLGTENPQQGNLWHDDYVPDSSSGLQGIRQKDSSHSGFNFRKESSITKMSGKNMSGKVGDKLEPVRKSKRVPKRHVFDGEFGEEDDDEIRYLEKLKLNVDASYKEEEGSGKKQRLLSKVGNIESGSSKSVEDRRKKLRPERDSGDMDLGEDGELVSDGELESDEKQKKESVDTFSDGKRATALTTRQRALQSNKDGSSTRGSGIIEFPDGLPPAPSRRHKEKLSEVGEQLKKTEAAQRRRMQVEKAAKESQAEAIRKILGQDSGRKKREEKIKQRQEELAQEKAANALKVAPNTIRCVNGPTGTVLTFSDGLPSIFDSKSSSYPSPRELCAGPSCANPYRYRHSKLNVPLCSLKCYKAVEEQMMTKTTN